MRIAVMREIADAKLIAAAPDLLKALKFCLAELGQYDNANTPGGDMERFRLKAIAMAEKAIRKSERKITIRCTRC